MWRRWHNIATNLINICHRNERERVKHNKHMNALDAYAPTWQCCHWWKALIRDYNIVIRRQFSVITCFMKYYGKQFHDVRTYANILFKKTISNITNEMLGILFTNITDRVTGSPMSDTVQKNGVNPTCGLSWPGHNWAEWNFFFSLWRILW